MRSSRRSTASTTLRLVQEIKIASTAGRRRKPPRRVFDGSYRNTGGFPVVPPVEGGDGGDVDAAFAEISDEVGVDLRRIGREQADAASRPTPRNAASAAVTGVVQATPGRTLWISANTASSPSVIVADVQPNADDVEFQARQDQIEARRDPRADRAQGFRIDVVVVEDARLIERDAGLRIEFAELVLHRLVGRQHDQADRGARGERRRRAATAARQDRSAGARGLRL